MSEPNLSQVDPDIAALIRHEAQRQHDKVRLIPSENYASRAVLEASSSVLSNKYSEGYAGKRYYEGQQFIDEVELLAISRIKPAKAKRPNSPPISWIFVATDLRGIRIGSSLLVEAAKLAAAEGAASLRVPQDCKLARYFERSGFVSVEGSLSKTIR